MIERKRLIHREYDDDGKTCIGFQYILPDEKGKPTESRFIFKKHENELNEISWRIQAFIPDSFSANLNSVIQFSFAIPKETLPLETICGIGLTLLQNQIKEQVQVLSKLDFDIGEIVKGV